MPQRTNITLDSFELANLGGDMLALAAHSLAFIILAIAVETGLCLALCLSCRRCARR